MKGNEFVGMLFLARDVAHSVHLNTRSFSKHEALNIFYNRIIGAADDFAESYIQTVVGDGERLIHKPKPDTVLIHFRLYKLNNDKNKVVGFGISAIGWIPEEQDDFQVFFNEEAAIG